MKKTILMISLITALASTNYAEIVKLPNIDIYEKSKKVSAILGDFNIITESFSVNNNKNITNTLSLGPFYYSYTNENNGHIIGFSKNITDYIISKYDVNMVEFYANKDKLMAEYESILNTYSNYLIKSKEKELQTDFYADLKLDQEILEAKYKNGLISKIDYETYRLELDIAENKLQLLKNEMHKLEYVLKQYKIDTNNLEEFEVKDLDYNKLSKYVKDENEKNKINNRLEKRNSLYKHLPTLDFNVSYDINNKNFIASLNIRKSFKIDMSDIAEDSLKFKKQFIEYSIENEKNEYELLLNNYKFAQKKENLSKETYNIDKLKYDLGKISYKQLIESRVKYNTSIINTLNSKNQLAIYLLKRGI